jgi:hypothetical protein
MKRFAILVLFLAGLLLPVSVQAQEPAAYIVGSTTPIDGGLRDALDAWLAVSPPSSAPYYAVTYTQASGGDTLVSLVGLDLASPEDDWNLEDGQAVWLGTVRVHADGSVEMFSAAAGAPKLASPDPAAGGGSYVAFPWQAGKAMMYGVRAIHGSGDYGTSGMWAVDLVSGDDLGDGAAPPYVYASDAGTIDYVCDDGTSVAVRTHNASTGDYFLYAHLLDNANLVLDHDFGRGGLLGSLKYGSFDDDCGWASQQDDHYHLHWMFVPSGGHFQAEGCILDFSTKKWTCGSTEIGTGQWLVGGVGTASDVDDPASSGATESGFFDLLVGGLSSMASAGVVSRLPDHDSGGASILTAFFNFLRVGLRLTWTLVRTNVSLLPAMTLFGIALGAQVLYGIGWLVAIIWRAVLTITDVFS